MIPILGGEILASDGKVVICTELDNSGVEKGIKTLSGQLSGFSNYDWYFLSSVMGNPPF